MQVLTLTNGDTKVFLIPEDDYEKALLTRLLSSECTVSTVPDSSRLYDKAVNDAVVIYSKLNRNDK
jgi:NADPH-dependent 7-cyano-7-deazaguanine reductase QueF